MTFETQDNEYHYITDRDTYSFYNEVDPDIRNRVIETLCTVDEGAGENNRIGHHILTRALELRGSISLPTIETHSASDPAWDQIRLILFVDRQNDDEVTPQEFLLTSMFSQTGEQIPSTAFYNPQGFGRFQILDDRTWTLTYATMDTDTLIGVSTQILLTYDNLQYDILYDAGTISSGNPWEHITSNNIKLIVLTKHGIAEYDLFWRLYFEG